MSKLNVLLLIAVSLLLTFCTEKNGGGDDPEPDFKLTEYSAENVSKQNKQMVFMHYMPWFETPETNNGHWGSHWTMANRNPEIIEDGKRQIASHYYPLIGPYASSDPDVIEYHLLLMKYAGVDGLLIDWYGITDLLDYAANKYNTDVLISKIKEVGLKYAIVYEDRILSTAAKEGLDPIQTAKADMAYIEYEYFTDENYWKVENEPVLLLFGPEELHTPNEWTQVFEDMNTKPMFITLHGFSGQAGANANGEFIWVDQASMTTKYQAKNNFDIFIGAAYTGFKDYYAEGGWGDAINFEIDHNNGLQYKELLDLAVSEDVDYVQLITWNDYGEGTMIEPTQEFGFTMLDYTQDFTGVSYTTTELEMIYDLYNLRQETPKSSDNYEKLDQAFYYLISLQESKARELIEGLK